jgi:RimJ/RimL family protein N-acetyltransferase
VTGAGRPLPLPDPPLADSQVRLRPWRPVEAPALVAAWADPLIARWTGVPRITDEAAARRWIAGDADRRARRLALDLVIEVAGEVAGEVGLAGFDGAGTAEIGWWVAARHRGRGVATAATRLFAPWAVDALPVEAVLARCHPDNPASGAVARAAGFELQSADPAVEVWRFPAPRGTGGGGAMVGA